MACLAVIIIREILALLELLLPLPFFWKNMIKIRRIGFFHKWRRVHQWSHLVLAFCVGKFVIIYWPHLKEYGILVPQPGLKRVSPALESGSQPPDHRGSPRGFLSFDSISLFVMGLSPPVFLFHRQRSLEDYSPWDHKELNMTEGLTFSLSRFSISSLKNFF